MGMPASTLYHVLFSRRAEADRSLGGSQDGLEGANGPTDNERRSASRQAVILGGRPRETRLGANHASHFQSLCCPSRGERPFLDYLLEMIERHGYEGHHSWLSRGLSGVGSSRGGLRMGAASATPKIRVPCGKKTPLGTGPAP